MEKRGGGVLDLELRNKTDLLDNYYQLHCTFETKDSMGANFINSCLERFAETFKAEAQHHRHFDASEKEIEIVMSILSNYVPGCIVRAEVSCPVSELEDHGMSGEDFAAKFVRALKIAEAEPYRAVTHNKGIMNGIDAVVLATGNDFRAVEAGIHAYASKRGKIHQPFSRRSRKWEIQILAGNSACSGHCRRSYRDCIRFPGSLWRSFRSLQPKN